LLIPDPDPDFLPILDPDPGVKKAPDPGSGYATLEKAIQKLIAFVYKNNIAVSRQLLYL
jgi:hypothetical protein